MQKRRMFWNGVPYKLPHGSHPIDWFGVAKHNTAFATFKGGFTLSGSFVAPAARVASLTSLRKVSLRRKRASLGYLRSFFMA